MELWKKTEKKSFRNFKKLKWVLGILSSIFLKQTVPNSAVIVIGTGDKNTYNSLYGIASNVRSGFFFNSDFSLDLNFDLSG